MLWDADKLTKMGVQPLAYNLSMNYMRRLNPAQRRHSMVPYTHSVLGRTVASINTAPARRIAEQRYRSRLAVLTTWEQEQEEEEKEEEVG